MPAYHIPIKEEFSIHSFARFLYWVSILLLLVGIWILIDPYNRKTGETACVYITLGAFELYMWLLLGLARWQISKNLFTDAARSGIFTLVLTGFLFIALNELYLAAAGIAHWFSIGALILALVKLRLALRWYRWKIPAPLLFLVIVWLVILASLSPVLRLSITDKPTQHVIVYVTCWLVAVFTACHLLAARWQKHKGFQTDSRPFSKWWIPWLLLAILVVLVVLQLYSAMWGLFVDWAQWYFSPIFLAIGVLAITLSHISGKRYAETWAVMGMTIMHAVLASHDGLPKEFPSVTQGVLAYLVHPLYPSGLFVSILFALNWILMQQWWFLCLALVAPVSAGAAKISQTLWNSRHGKGIAIVLGAFLLLVIGAGLQWVQVHWEQRRSKGQEGQNPDGQNDVLAVQEEESGLGNTPT